MPKARLGELASQRGRIQADAPREPFPGHILANFLPQIRLSSLRRCAGKHLFPETFKPAG
jgi:hypothetical protein